ncbi:reticulon-like protein B14 [Mercurialis annua]|uniref:reticulon-like protein B14 n=1 Tax=Mercurialis annua TaxID=3986 RepID=UPI0024ADA0E7|nr:reticulon-like protein B14 [Mercurialis annua]
MALSVTVLVIVTALHLIAFVLAIGAESRRSHAEVLPDKYDERTYCKYTTDASTVYGLGAFGLLLISQAVVNGVTRCLCCGKGLLSGTSSTTLAIVFFIGSWLPGIQDSDSDEYHTSSAKLFGRRRSIHAILGRGNVAEILLWKNKYLSGGILMGFTLIWFLFEVVEYHFITLLCHLLLILLVTLFLWSTGAGFGFIKRDPPTINDIELPESTLRFFFGQINRLLSNLYEISSGKDLPTFFWTIICLWILSAFGSLCDTLTLSYIVYLCVATLPALYERYEDQVDRFAGKSSQDMKYLFARFNSKVLDKIPRGPTKQKKHS